MPEMKDVSLRALIYRYRAKVRYKQDRISALKAEIIGLQLRIDNAEKQLIREEKMR